ncbi:hypothetical protein BH10ACI1_BH10ACI1_26720 [soil metagenome]
MASEVKKRTPAKSDSHINEILAVILLAMAVLVFLCLISYSPNDSTFNTASTQKTQNWIGIVGAYLADLLIQAIGWTAYFLPAMLVLMAWRFFRAVALTFSISRIIGYLFFIVSFSSLLALLGSHGGVTGAFFDPIFSRFLGRIGTGVLLLTFLATSILLITNISFAAFFGDFGLAWENFRMRFNEWRGKRLEERDSNNNAAIERAEKRRESCQEIPEMPKTDESPTISMGDVVTTIDGEKKGAVTKKVTDIFNTLKNLPENKKAETLISNSIAKEDLVLDEDELLEIAPTISASEETVSEEIKPIDLVAESEKIPITPIQETGELDEDFLDISDEEEKISQPKKPQSFENYVLPTAEFLMPAAPRIEQKDEELLGIAQELTDKTKEFNVTGRVMHICQGPVVTTYEFKPDPGVKYSRVTSLSDDLCLALKAESIRIDRIPGKAFVGIEVPNRERETIHLREVIESKKFQASDSLLSIALGKSIDGLNYIADLTKMPHLLMAGQTGAGKSVGVNSLIVSILYKAKPDEVKFIMVDPKQVELGIYADIPHLATPIIKDPKRAAVALKWAVSQMEKRYKDLAAWGVRNIDGYNADVKRRNEAEQFNENGEAWKKLPYLVIIIDELADLMMVAGKEVEESITRLAQMARAVGIHLVLATQRPSVDVITGLIKANFPSRISFRVSSKVDSRTIIDSNGAESLLGKGDMLFLPPGVSNLIRVHGAFVDEKEINKIVEYIKTQGNPEYDTTITKTDEELDDSGDLPGKKDPLFWDAVKSVVSAKRASTSLLQRHLRIGYGRAAAILDAMVREGYIGEMDGSTRARAILQKAYEDLQEMEEGKEF